MKRTENDPADTDCVVSAANYLEQSEFKIFSDAYAAWYGKAASEKQMERIFTGYLLENKVPVWVRNYARSRIEGFTPANEKENARIANNLLYLATVIAEYVLLGSYIVMR
jgi:hypothetical protein